MLIGAALMCIWLPTDFFLARFDLMQDLKRIVVCVAIAGSEAV